MTLYLDCAATTPVEQEVAEELLRYTVDEFGNAGSRTHDFGVRAKRRVGRAREQVSAVVHADPGDVVFTSGATESNNLAIFGLEAYGRESGRTHIVSTQIEHKAVLEPLEVLAERGFDVELVPPGGDGLIDANAIRAVVRDDTLLVSLMQANNETGVLQPVSEVAHRLADHEAFLHVDAAQGFGKDLEELKSPRIDLISVSGHKLYAPKGVGALIARRSPSRRVPLAPLMFGGGQERGLRPGTLAVGMIAALGTASELALRNQAERLVALETFKGTISEALEAVDAEINGAADRALATTVNASIPGLDAEAAMVALKGLVAISNGSACTSQSYEPSHVLRAMCLPEERIARAIRISWSHLTPPLDGAAFAQRLTQFAVA